LNVNILLKGKLILPYKLEKDSHFDRALLSFQNGVYYNNSQNETIKILPNDAQKNIFDWGNYHIIMISSSTIKGIQLNEDKFWIGENSIFFELQIEGKISVYTYKRTTTNPPSIVTNTVLVKENGETIKKNKKSFR
jgi:hypothetical protein